MRGADSDRRVSLRPAPDTMARLTALLPVAQGVAAYAALLREADSRISQGDDRGRGQLMADTLVERLTGQAEAGDVPVEINLIMSTEALVDPAGPGGSEPAHLDGYGPIPAPIGRELALGPASGGAPRWVRRHADDIEPAASGGSPCWRPLQIQRHAALAARHTQCHARLALRVGQAAVVMLNRPA